MGWFLLVLGGLAYLALGPWSVVGMAALLVVPRPRRWILPRLPRIRRPWRFAGAATATVAVVALGVLLLPDGRLPLPQAGGLLATPAYDGRQVSAQPLDVTLPPAHPWLAPPGRGSTHADAWNSAATTTAGPLGDDPQVETAWYGLDRCTDLFLDSHPRLVALCRSGGGRSGGGRELRVIDPESLRPLVTKGLPDATTCTGHDLFLDQGDRLVVATDRQIQAISTIDAAREPDLTVSATWDLKRSVAEGDCLVAVLPDWSGRIWWATEAGTVGFIDPVDQGIRSLELGERVTEGFAADETGVYLVTDTSVQRLTVDPDGEPMAAWRTEYDRGVEQKSGQRTRGSGGAVTLLDDGLVAFTDNAEPRLQVVVLQRATGEQVCSAGVFDGGESATETSLVSLGSGVVVTNTHGYDGPGDTRLGFTPTGGMARVDHADGECRVRWHNPDVVVPSSRPVVSWGTGLVYAWTKRPTWTGVAAWYLTAVDVADGRTAFSVRGGTGRLADSRGAGLLVTPDGSVLTGVAGGLVRVRDRVRGSRQG